MRRLDAQLQHLPDRLVPDVEDSRKRFVEARLLDHSDDRHPKRVVGPEYLNAAGSIPSADLRAVITEEPIEANPIIGIKRRRVPRRDNPAEIADRPQRGENESVFPERFRVRGKFEVIGEQHFATRTRKDLAAVDPFWHDEIPALEDHIRRKAATSVPVQTVSHLRK